MSVQADVPFSARIGVRLALLQGAILALLLVIGTGLFQRQLLCQARRSLHEQTATLLPYLLPGIRPAVDLAVDDLTGQIDRDLLQLHIVKDAFNVANQHPAFAYAEFVLPGGERAVELIAGGVERGQIELLFAGKPLSSDALMDTDDLVGQQAVLRSADGARQLGTVRLAFSLAPARGQARETILLVVLLGVGAFVLAFALTAGLGQHIVQRPMEHLLSAAHRISEGRLATRVAAQGSGETALLGQALETMTRSLGRLIGAVQSTSREVAHGVTAIADSSRRLLQGAKKQRESVSRVQHSAAQVDNAARQVEQSIAELTRATDSVAGAASSLTRNMTNLTPTVASFDAYVRDTDAIMQRIALLASEIAERATTMAAGATDSAERAHEAETSGEQIGRIAGDAIAVSQHVRTTAEECQNATAQAIEATQRIAEAFDRIRETAARLNASTQSIVEVVGVISEIAARTKLLSLNASILAAQAGEQGVGFSVIAGEVKDLASRTSESIDQVAQLITNVDSDRRSTEEAITAGVQTIRQGQQLSVVAGQAIERILGLTATSHAHTRQIAEATRQQVRASVAAADSARRIATLGQGVLTTTQEQKQAAQTVTGMTSHLVQSISKILGTLGDETQSAKTVSEQVARIRGMAQDILAQMKSQRALSQDIAAVTRTIEDFAKSVVAEAEAVVQDGERLGSRTRLLDAEVMRFEVMDEKQA